MSSRSSYTCRFFVLPCCFFDFAGRYHRRQSRKTQYREYLDFVLEVGLSCGFHMQEDCLRIPSTKRVCARAGTEPGSVLCLGLFQAFPSEPIFRTAPFSQITSCQQVLPLWVGEGSVWGVRDLGFVLAIPLLIMKTKEAHAVSDPVLPLRSLGGAQSVLDSHTAGGDQTHQMPHCSKPRQDCVTLMEFHWLLLLVCTLTLELVTRGKCGGSSLDALGTCIVSGVMLAG